MISDGDESETLLLVAEFTQKGDSGILSDELTLPDSLVILKNIKLEFFILILNKSKL